MTALTPTEFTTLTGLTSDQLAAVEQTLTTRFAHLDEYMGARDGFHDEMSAEAEAHFGGAA